jgi:predicted peptidase
MREYQAHYERRREEGILPPLEPLVILPPGYDAAEPDRRLWPVLVNLHGNVERRVGDLSVLEDEPLVRLLRERPEPLILVCPLLPPGEYWPIREVQDLVGRVLLEYRADPDRVYLTGGSMGGGAAYVIAADRPDLFAALAPVCGYGDPLDAASLAGLPVWVFQGDSDPHLAVEPVRELVEALRAAREGAAEVRYTEFTGAGHDIGRRSYETPGFFEWLLGKQRRTPTPLHTRGT